MEGTKVATSPQATPGASRRSRAPAYLLLLLAPSIPELLTGSTPITRLAFDPIGFAVGFALDILLYGCGALLIREFAILLRKGWATILVWGAAYGIAEEGLAVHTFFERSGAPVGQLTTFGAAGGVDWLWALGLTVFHATYSIALPILLVHIVYPAERGVRWFGTRGLAAIAVGYFADVAFLAVLVGHGPTHGQLAGALLGEAALLIVGAMLPADLLRPRRAASRLGLWGIGVAGALEWIGWLTVLIFAGSHRTSAWAAGGLLVVLDAAAVAAVVWGVGTDRLERSEVAFAAGMLVPLLLFGIAVEAQVPGILLLDAGAGYLLYRLVRAVWARSPSPAFPPAAAV